MLDRYTSATPEQLLHIHLNDHRTERSPPIDSPYGHRPRMRAPSSVTSSTTSCLRSRRTSISSTPSSPRVRSRRTAEALTVGVLGKRMLWMTIAGLPPGHPAASAVDASRLIARAESQAQRLEELSQRAAAIAFTGRNAQMVGGDDH